MPDINWKLYFEELGALERGHFVLASGRHSDTYLEKRKLEQYPGVISDLCSELALVVGRQFSLPQVVVGPAYGGILVASWTGYYLQEFFQETVCTMFAEKLPESHGHGYFLRQIYRKQIPGKKVLVVDDIITTGGTVRSVAEYVRDIGGKVCQIAVLCNRGGMTSEQVGGFPLFSLIDMRLDDWEPKDCLLCRNGIPLTPRW